MGLFGSKEERAKKIYQKALEADARGNKDKAGDLYLKATKLGHAGAEWRFGLWAEDRGWSGISNFESAAQKGYLPAVESCIACYLDENYKRHDFKKGRYWIEQIKNLELPENNECARRLRLYATPDGTCTLALEMLADEKKMQSWRYSTRARGLLKRAAGDGSVAAQMACGEMYRKGLYGLEKPDMKLAFQYYKQAAPENELARLAAVWLAYNENRAIGNETCKIKPWCLERVRQTKEGKKEDDPAIGYFLVMACDNSDRQQDVEDADRLRWCIWADKRGVRDESLRCARMYAAGRGTKPDAAKAAEWYNTALERGRAEALVELGDLYRTGGPGLAQNSATALECYERAALYAKPRQKVLDVPVDNEEAGARGLARCGECYLLGGAIEQDTARGLDYYIRAAHCFADMRPDQADRAGKEQKNGFPGAAAAGLGLAFFAAGLEREAFALLRFAGEQINDPRMMLPLAALYCKGVPPLQKPDQKQAQLWFERWRKTLRPGKSVTLGGYPQEVGVPYSHGDAYCPGLFEPLVWTVLKVEDNRVLLLCEEGLCYMYPRWTLPDVSALETRRIFPSALRQFVDGTVFSLTRAEFEEYLKKKRIAGSGVSATMYARFVEGINHGLHTDRLEDGGISVHYSSSSPEPGRDLWLSLLTTRESVWRLADGAVDRKGEFTDKPWRNNDMVARPAVWIQLDGGEREDARTL